jgi:hypothetical protein
MNGPNSYLGPKISRLARLVALALIWPDVASAQRISPAAVAYEPADSVQIVQRDDCKRRRTIGRVVGGSLAVGALVVAMASEANASDVVLVYAWAGSWAGLLGSAFGGLIAAPDCRFAQLDPDPRGCVANVVVDARHGAFGGAITGFLVAPVAVFPLFLLADSDSNAFGAVLLAGTATRAVTGAVLRVFERRRECQG